MKNCQRCGTQLDDNASQCPRCGADIQRSTNPFADQPLPVAGGPAYYPPPPPPSATDDPAMSWVIPVHNPVLAIISSYCGLIGLGCPILGPIAVVTGFLAIQQIRKTPGLTGMGRCIFGIVSGIIGSLFLLLVILGLIASTLS